MDHREEPVEVRETQPLNDDQPTKLSQFNKWVGNQKRELN
jgi:hypothetical protein